MVVTRSHDQPLVGGSLEIAQYALDCYSMRLTRVVRETRCLMNSKSNIRTCFFADRNMSIPTIVRYFQVSARGGPSLSLPTGLGPVARGVNSITISHVGTLECPRYQTRLSKRERVADGLGDI
jgi:hypothetical protein